MATSNSQRIGIWIIAVVMVVGTIGSFFLVVIANQNDVNDQEAAQVQYEKYLKDQAEMAAEARKANLPLDGYKTDKFDGDKVTELKVEVLKKGKGEVLKADSTILANYFGWTQTGEIFDSTNKKVNDKPTLTPAEFSLSGVIEGWTKGLTGVKVGSVVLLTIPPDMAYGNTDDGSGRPFGTLKFVVEVKELK